MDKFLGRQKPDDCLRRRVNPKDRVTPQECSRTFGHGGYCKWRDTPRRPTALRQPLAPLHITTTPPARSASARSHPASQKALHLAAVSEQARKNDFEEDVQLDEEEEVVEEDICRGACGDKDCDGQTKKHPCSRCKALSTCEEMQYFRGRKWKIYSQCPYHQQYIDGKNKKVQTPELTFLSVSFLFFCCCCSYSMLLLCCCFRYCFLRMLQFLLHMSL